MQKLKKPISIILSILMVVSMFIAVPITASAAVGDFVPESEYLTFTAVEAGASVTLKYTGGTLQYNINNSGWQSYTVGSLIALAKGDSVRFRGKNTTFNGSNHVSIDGKVACSGNVMSLRLDDDGMSQGLSTSCFSNMFSGCTGLTAAPELPETTLAAYCYSKMFAGCTNLTAAPALPATTLVTSCYSEMFAGCTSLTTAPKLPATTLAPMCYQRMFYVCTSLTTAPELPATELAYGCYGYMFAGCSSIKLSETQTAEYSIPYSVPSGGDATPASPTTLKNMFAGTGGTFTGGTPEINKTYYMYREVPKYTVTWKNGDTTLETDTDVAEGTTPTYNGNTPEKAADNYYTYTFAGWSPAVAPVSADVTYTAQYTATAKTFKVNVKKLNGGTYTIENLTGETTVAQLKEIIADQIDIPATAQRLIFAGKEIEDAKTLAENNIQKESTIHLIIRSYTVTWLNYDNSELGTTNVQYGSTPTYNGEPPTKPEDEQNTYTFAGWSPEVSAVTGNATYTAQFDATPKVVELPEVIKDCTNTRDSVIFANVPFIQPGDFSTLVDGAINFVSLAGGFALFDAKDYSYKFYDKNGTEIAATLSKEQSFPGSAVGLSDDVTIYNKEYQLSNTELDKYYIVATAPAVDLFTGHSVTLGGNVGVNFFLNPAVLDTYTGTKTVKFTVDGEETTVDVPETPETDGYKVTCNVVAAQMAHKIKAVVYVDGTALDQTDSYSVQDYAEGVYKDENNPEKLRALAKAMLNYGAMAQTVFDSALKDHPALANKTVGNNGYEGVTADQIGDAVKGTSADLNKVAEKLGAEFYTSSLIYLSENTLRLYFTPASKTVGALDGKGFSDSLSGYYYYVDHENIPAAELDEQKELTVGDYTFTYTALDYAKAVVNSGMGGDQKNLAKALFLYNQAANDYFGGGSEPEPAVTSFTKVTDVNQITSENIGECTFEEAKAWVLANWDDIRDNDNIVDVVYFVGTMTILKSISLYPDMSKQDFEEQAYEENPSINDLQFWFTNFVEDIYLCSKAS